jgi:hypothetical protein
VRECPACRDAIDEQRWIDTLLRSSAAYEEPAPATILESFRGSRSRRRKAMLAACGLAAAAVLLMAAGWTVLRSRQAIGPTAAEVAISDDPGHAEPPAKPPRATFVGGPDLIVVPVQSPHPDVTIVRVYRTYQAASDPLEPGPVHHLAAAKRDRVSSFAPDESNGG